MKQRDGHGAWWRRGGGGRGSDEAGQITAMVVVCTAGLLLFTGLVLDGGLALAGKVDAADAAQEAARSGSQQIDLAQLRATRHVRLDRQRAAEAALRYVQATGDKGRVFVSGDRVTVTVTHRQRTQILSLVGLDELVTTATAIAQPEQGITRPWTTAEASTE